jgi:hypothetical protein
LYIDASRTGPSAYESWRIRPTLYTVLLHVKMEAASALLHGADPTFERERLEAHASKLGLDLARFRTALDERNFSMQVGEDLELSERLAIRNLPTLFINGRRVEFGGGGRGQVKSELTAEVLRAHIEKALQDADQRLKQGVAREQLYAAIVANGVAFGARSRWRAAAAGPTGPIGRGGHIRGSLRAGGRKGSAHPHAGLGG